MNKYDLINYRQFKVKFLPWSKTKPNHIKIWEQSRGHNHKTCSKTFPYDYGINDTWDQAIDILDRNGFKPVCRTFESGYLVVLCDAYGASFKEVTTLK